MSVMPNILLDKISRATSGRPEREGGELGTNSSAALSDAVLAVGI